MIANPGYSSKQSRNKNTALNASHKRRILEKNTLKNELESFKKKKKICEQPATKEHCSQSLRCVIQE